ncbi:MAG: hypothetical protein R3A52_18425 [Polyangiales bacterium]
MVAQEVRHTVHHPVAQLLESLSSFGGSFCLGLGGRGVHRAASGEPEREGGVGEAVEVGEVELPRGGEALEANARGARGVLAGDAERGGDDPLGVGAQRLDAVVGDGGEAVAQGVEGELRGGELDAVGSCATGSVASVEGADFGGFRGREGIFMMTMIRRSFVEGEVGTFPYR